MYKVLCDIIHYGCYIEGFLLEPCILMNIAMQPNDYFNQNVNNYICLPHSVNLTIKFPVGMLVEKLKHHCYQKIQGCVGSYS